MMNSMDPVSTYLHVPRLLTWVSYRNRAWLPGVDLDTFRPRSSHELFNRRAD